MSRSEAGQLLGGDDVAVVEKLVARWLLTSDSQAFSVWDYGKSFQETQYATAG